MSQVKATELPEREYTPASPLKQPGQLLRAMVTDLMLARELGWRLFVRDTSAQYRQSLLGYVWAIAPPLVTTLIWGFLNSSGVLKFSPTGVPYPVFVLTGLLLWEAFASALRMPLAQVASSSSLLTKINFPREALLLAAMGQVLFVTSIRLVLLAVVFTWYQVPVPATIILAPIGFLAVMGLGFAIGLLLIPLGILYQDVERALNTGLGILFFLTPVVYPPPTAWPASLLASLNPVSAVLNVTRDAMTNGHLVGLTGFAWVFGATLFALAIGWVLYRISMPHMIARMSA